MRSCRPLSFHICSACSARPRQVKTTKLCEHWIQSELMDEDCMVTCASVSHAVYGAQGTDPMVCEHVSTELTKVIVAQVNLL